MSLESALHAFATQPLLTAALAAVFLSCFMLTVPALLGIEENMRRA
jgi:hypothetical protein